MEYFNVCNKYGERTEEIVERGEAHKKGICHRTVHLWILNQNNEVLIQQRSADKESGANLWYVSVGGHIEASENIESTLIRETKEELGLDISGLTGSITYLYTFAEKNTEHDGRYIDNEFYNVFALRTGFTLDQIVKQPEEVQAVKYISYEDFKRLITEKDKSFLQHEVGYKMLLPALDNFLGGFADASLRRSELSQTRLGRAPVDIRLAYDDMKNVQELFSEYTKLLLDLESGFQEYLDLQGYDDELEHLNVKYGTSDGRLYLAYIDNQAAGCIALRRLSETECEIKRLYVRPRFRGKGIASVLVNTILNDAKEIGYKHVLLDTLPSLKSAIKLYESIGFYRIPSYNDSPVSGTVYLKNNL